MFATLYNVAVDLPLQESGWAVAFLWLCRCLYLFSYIRCYCCGGCCPGAACPACDCGGPEQFQVVVSGVGNDACSDCGSFNNTYILDRGQSPGGRDCAVDGQIVGTQTYCVWTYDLPATICSTSLVSWRKTFIELWMIHDTSGDLSALHVNFYADDAGSGCTRNFEYWTGSSIAGTFDCCALNESVPLFDNIGGVCTTSSDAIVTTV
jgi:hypothetical protein